MKFYLLFLAIGIAICFTPVAIYAHDTSGLPYVRINGEYVVENPIRELVPQSSIRVSQDVATGSAMVVGQTILFEIDVVRFPEESQQATSAFGLPIENQHALPDPLFRWNFQDGSDLAQGPSVTHIYKSPGSYLVTLEVKNPGKTSDYKIINSIQVMVVPTTEYIIPKASIFVDGKKIDDEQGANPIPSNTQIYFDASKSEGLDLTYEWDFGDGKTSVETSVRHAFDKNNRYPVVLLRVTDGNNITSDAIAPLITTAQRTSIVSDIIGMIVGMLRAALRIKETI